MLVVPLATVSGCCEVEYCGTLKVRVAGVKESALAAVMVSVTGMVRELAPAAVIVIEPW